LTAALTAYDRELEWDEPPSREERRYAGWAVVRASGAPAPSWSPLGRIADVALYLAPPGHAQDAPALYAVPVLPGKRGRRRSRDYVGVDGQICLPDCLPDRHVTGAGRGGDGTAAPYAAVVSPLHHIDSLRPRTIGLDGIAGDGERRSAVRVAVVDVSFDNLGALADLGSPDAVVDGPFLVGLPGGGADPAAAWPAASPLSAAPGHGTVMAGIVLAEVPGVRVGLFRIPGVAGAARPYLAPTDLAGAIAAAVEGWEADVVLVAMSDGAWGTPRHLGDVLRAAGRAGRDGRGAAILCSVGDPSRNHVRLHDSAALGADDLASQPWVQAVAACDGQGRWYRVYPNYDGSDSGGDGVAYNRLGPAVALCAPGEPRRFGDRIAADDSSQATALAAAAAARALAQNPDLLALELRALLALTADVPAVVDGGPGLASGIFDGRDRQGHSLKIGYGVVNAQAACLAAADPVCLALLATREVPDPAPGSAVAGLALRLAEAWLGTVRARAAAGGAGGALARDYAEVAGQVSRLYLRSLEVKEAISWLARHVRALLQGGGSWWSAGQDHGALVIRIRHAAEVIAHAGADDRLARWAARLDGALGREAGAGSPAGAAPDSTVATFLASVFAPVRTDAAFGHILSWGGLADSSARLHDEGSGKET
jgi:hypothetical protein